MNADDHYRPIARSIRRKARRVPRLRALLTSVLREWAQALAGVAR